MTLGKLADDIILRITKSNPTDDSEIEKDQIIYLLSQARDGIVKSYLDKMILANQPIDTMYVERFIGPVNSVESQAVVDAINERIFITLPKQPLALLKDLGIVQVLTDDYLPVMRYHLENFTVLNSLRYAKPSPENLCFYREGNKIIIKGIKSINTDSDHFIVDYIPALASTNPTADDDVILSDALLSELTGMVEETMRKQMYDTAQDLNNDGVQEPK